MKRFPRSRRRIALCNWPGCQELRLPGSGHRYCEHHFGVDQEARQPQRRAPSGKLYRDNSRDSGESIWQADLESHTRQVRATLKAFGIGRL